MAAAAAFLANLGSTDQAAEAPKGPRTLAKHLAGSHLVSKLLAAAATAPASTLEFQETCRYASAMLGAPDTATALLSPPGNCTNVLSLASASPELRAAALTALASPQLTLGDAAPPDVDHALHAATTRRQPDDQRLLALRLLRCWAQDSVRNCQALSASGAGEALHTAANTVGPEERDARAEIAALMQTLAADAPAGTLRMLRMEGWLWPALCFAADAAGAEDWALAEASMAAFSAAVRRGCKVPAALVQGSVLPLLRQLASISSAQPQKSKAKGGVAHPQVDERTAQELRVSIANCVQALAEGQGAAGTLQSDDRMAWADIFLSWLTESSSEVDAKAQRAQQGRVVSDAAVGALSAMASPPGAEGLQVAHAWLAEMIVHLSRQVQLKKLTPSAPASEAMQEDSGSAWYWTEYFKPSYWRYGSKGTGQSQEGVLAATGAVGEAGGPASGPTAAESAIVQTEADLELATEAEKALAGVLQSSVEAASLTGKSSWSAWVPGLPSFWKSRGSEGGDQGRAEGVARSPSDSELAQYITAAPVGPLYARAVAAELIEASGRVGES